jgi:hypothetical protein
MWLHTEHNSGCEQRLRRASALRLRPSQNPRAVVIFLMYEHNASANAVWEGDCNPCKDLMTIR